ncbi:sensor histidine kinase [Fusibacter ferrireducens]|uniref:histidine kinase n=1 Tax=Fusibacter ferrireducens TaxID=2785058 RepID=A0ABR9ZR45_9FIRM|nr:HAMP domain-containing sensor histidine kinase [Fusibacter ferrireducens]MBF4692628.1 HAMP domain-containing histidine kinase [Fusibacter ferrireducens]
MMTIRKLWLISLIGIAISSILIYGIIMTSLTNQYFKAYMTESYTNHVEQVLNYTKRAMSESSISYRQMAIELETHIIDPITHIKLYDKDGTVLVDVNNNETSNFMMMNGKSMREMMKNASVKYSSEVDQYEIRIDGELKAVLNVTRQSSAENGFVARLFKANLIRNSFLAIGISVFLSIIIGIFISKHMAKNLIETADLAQSLLMDENLEFHKSNIREVNIIRESLEKLSTRLKLKQKSRKKLVDQLVHQTRTPMTVLRTHLEGIEDEIIKLDRSEHALLQLQIEDVAKIIENMSNVIDVETMTLQTSVESIELSAFFRQMIAGLKAQFDRKGIELQLLTHEKQTIKSDRHLLSQMMYNLLTNAYKYTSTEGSVSLSYETFQDQLMIHIKDSGIGIPAEEQEQIFNAYYRGSNHVQISGDGLGLYLVKENLKLLNGAIQVVSESHEGSEFIVKLPMVLEEVD